MTKKQVLKKSQPKKATKAGSSKKEPQKQALPKKSKSLKKASLKKKSPPKAKTSAAASSRDGLDLQFLEKQLKKLLSQEREEKLILKDIDGRKYCVVENCDYPAIVEDHCRQHFFSSFQTIKSKRQILDQNRLEESFKLLFEIHSFKILKQILKDLSSDKNFKLAIRHYPEEDKGEEAVWGKKEDFLE